MLVFSMLVLTSTHPAQANCTANAGGKWLHSGRRAHATYSLAPASSVLKSTRYLEFQQQAFRLHIEE